MEGGRGCWLPTSTRLSRSMGLPSCSQLTSCTGWPETMHWNCASLSTSTVCTCGCRCAVNGAEKQREREGKEREGEGSGSCLSACLVAWLPGVVSNHSIDPLTCHRERHLNCLLASCVVYPAQIFATVLETRLQWHKSMAITIFGFHFHADNCQGPTAEGEGDNFIHTLVILSSPADTMVMRSLSCSGSSCSFSSLNQLQREREKDEKR